GIPARLKFPIQLVLAVPVAVLAMTSGGAHQHLLPDWPWLLYPLAVLAIVGAANAVNITDGMDGLAGGLSVIAVAAVVLLVPGAAAGEKAVAMSLCGAMVAFLVFNRFPLECSWATPARWRSATRWPRWRCRRAGSCCSSCSVSCSYSRRCLSSFRWPTSRPP